MISQAGAVVYEDTTRGDVVHVVGDLDRSVVPQLDDMLQRAVAAAGDVTVDLTRCRYIGSLGMRVLLRAREQARGRFTTLVDPASDAARMLNIAKVQELLGIRHAPRVHSRELHAREPEAHVRIITLEGEWDLSRGSELRERLEEAVTHPRVILDMTNVRYMDQFCVGMLLRARTQRVAKGYPQAHLVIANANVRRILGMAGFHSLWTMCETLDEALAPAQ